MTADILYSDKLVEITQDTILFRDYYYIPAGSKRVRFTDLAGVTGEEPTLQTGKYRIQGTGDLRTWFPFDWNRPKRKKIFFLHFARSRRRIGFTVEDADQVERFFRSRALWMEDAGSTKQ